MSSRTLRALECMDELRNLIQQSDRFLMKRNAARLPKAMRYGFRPNRITFSRKLSEKSEPQWKLVMEGEVQ